ncbi:MAG: DUF1192 family protein [Azospirillum sp.]|nr:DUF1192 family protein [Azospirillum sp.]
MDLDELEPRKAKPVLKDLTTLGVAELEHYIAGLQAEIERAQAMIKAKQAQRSSAESFFKR